jgi:hypothetical protein
MNTNAATADVRRMRDLNNDNSQQCIAEYYSAPWWRKLFGTLNPSQCLDIEISAKQAALLMWGMKVRQNGDWDHKPKLRSRYNGDVWYEYEGRDYYYDIFSNIHYGYVGVAAGFSGDDLLDGAGLEQIASDVLRRRAPSCDPAVKGLRCYDDASDRTAISIGVELRNVNRNKYVSVEQVMGEIVGNTNLSSRPAKQATGS